jgi:hypothetical protein
LKVEVKGWVAKDERKAERKKEIGLMNTIRRNIQAVGYDREEAYFYERDQECIAELRKQLKLEVIQGGKSEEVKASESASTQEEVTNEEKKAA